MCAEKLRLQQSLCRKMMVFLETNRFKGKEMQYNPSVLVRLPFATDSTLELAKFAVGGLKQIYKEQFLYKRAGVILMDFEDADRYQPSLFLNSNPKHKLLMEKMDAINRKYHKDVVHLGVQDFTRHKMRQEHLSRQYTTNIRDILVVEI